MKSTLRRAALAAALITLAACQTEIQHGLSENEANEIYVLLERNPKIPANKGKEEGGREITWKISVPQAYAADAMRRLKENELPRTRTPGLEIFNRGSLIPTATEERAMFLQAISGELTRTLTSIDGVLDARVHLNMPQSDDLSDKTARPEASAAVFLKYRWNADSGKKPTPPISEEQVQQMVSKSVQDLKPTSVSVITAPATLPGGTEATGPAEVDLFGVRMTADSVATFRFILGLLVVIILGQAAYIIFATVTRGRSVPHRPRTEA